MADPCEQLNSEQCGTDLKVHLNASQTITGLQSVIRQKDEIIMKIETDRSQKMDSYKIEIKKLQEALHESESRETKLKNELLEKMKNEDKMNRAIEEFEKTIQNQIMEQNQLIDILDKTKVNLATLEAAFSDVIEKFERAKNIIEGYKTNEDAFHYNIQILEKTLKKAIESYESLKNHAKCQMENANKENLCLRTKANSMEIKQNAALKRLKIKIEALEVSVEQKTKECLDLAALCDEVTGKKIA